LSSKMDYQNFNISKWNDAFHWWKDSKKEDIKSFQDNYYVSAMTGTEAVPHHTNWKRWTTI
jgi:trimethylamine monooxygenase